jgi:cytochrome c-type biogenesis protein CcmH/NrfF
LGRPSSRQHIYSYLTARGTSFFIAWPVTNKVTVLLLLLLLLLIIIIIIIIRWLRR